MPKVQQNAAASKGRQQPQNEARQATKGQTEADDSDYVLIPAIDPDGSFGLASLGPPPNPGFWTSMRLKRIYKPAGAAAHNNSSSEDPTVATPEFSDDDENADRISTWIDATAAEEEEEGAYRRRNCHSETSTTIPSTANDVTGTPPGLLRKSAPPLLDSAPVLDSGLALAIPFAPESPAQSLQAVDDESDCASPNVMFSSCYSRRSGMSEGSDMLLAERGWSSKQG